jgi:hypothetical protein
MGFKTLVVDLRMESEGTAEEKKAVEGQGLRWPRGCRRTAW